eukprot:237194_1
MVTITSLFLNKLSIVMRFTLENNKSTDRTKSDNELIDLITKTTLLSLIAMLTTFISCILLLFRFSMFGNHPIVSVISDWVVSIDIYCNFACYSLSFKYFHRYYVTCAIVVMLNADNCGSVWCSRELMTFHFCPKTLQKQMKATSSRSHLVVNVMWERMNSEVHMNIKSHRNAHVRFYYFYVYVISFYLDIC